MADFRAVEDGVRVVLGLEFSPCFVGKHATIQGCRTKGGRQSARRAATWDSTDAPAAPNLSTGIRSYPVDSTDAGWDC
jgi:hypothetical protein